MSYYITSLKSQPFQKIYIDAFAGTGSITIGTNQEVIEGSARLALNTKNKFDKYIFIEKNKEFKKELNDMIAADFCEIKDRIVTYNAECNIKLQELCGTINWKNSRALLFLDPYATEVKWETLRTIAATKSIDVWYLFPLSAANRLLKNDGEIEQSWKTKLDTIFGDSNWYEEFYKEDLQLNLFGENNKYKKSAKAIGLALRGANHILNFTGE